MVALVSTVAYLGLEARSVEVQCQIAPGLPKFHVVGLPDKAVGESRQRVQAALAAMGLSLPPKIITINLSPADLPKEGTLSTDRNLPILGKTPEFTWVALSLALG